MKARFSLYLTLLSLSAFAQIRVVSSASIFQDMAKRIGGEHITSETIVPIGSDPHTYEPTPSDVTMVQKADLILVNGLTFEEWINALIDNSGTTAPTKTITEGIEPIQSEKYTNAYDPHAWMDASNGLIYIKNILDALMKVDNEHADYYKANYDSYRKELEDLDNYIVQQIERIPVAQRVLITSHDAFAYFGKRYGLSLNAIMGISTQAEARSSDIIRVTKAIRDNQVPAIFVESTINPKLILQVAADNDVVVGGELYADSVGKKGSAGDSYLKMLRHNTDVITAALSRPMVQRSANSNEEPSGNGNLYLGVLGLLLVGLVIAFIVLRR